MTNLEYIKTSNLDDLADVFLLFEMGLLEQITGKTAKLNPIQIAAEKNKLKTWLTTEIIEGKYLN